MKKITTLIALCLISYTGYSQQTGQVSRGSLGIGLHWACPQSELQDINYDDGLGLNLSYLSRKYPYKSAINFQVGARMDFARLSTRDFEDIVVIDENDVPLPGGATVTATNRMYGFLGMGRINFAPEGSKFTPYVDLLFGHRNYTTFQELNLNDQSLINEGYESPILTNRVVHTNRFHYGGSLGLSYRVSPGFSLESSVTYTFGEVGAALPLEDITRVEGSNEIRYDNFQNVKTDILLINVGMRIDLWKRYTYRQRTNPTTNTNTPAPTPQNTRYKDNTPTNTKTSTTRTGGTRTTGGVRGTPGRTPTKTPVPVKKKEVKIKSDGLKKDKNDKS